MKKPFAFVVKNSKNGKIKVVIVNTPTLPIDKFCQISNDNVAIGYDVIVEADIQAIGFED